jgi:hypothetical protein
MMFSWLGFSTVGEVVPSLRSLPPHQEFNGIKVDRAVRTAQLINHVVPSQ